MMTINEYTRRLYNICVSELRAYPRMYNVHNNIIIIKYILSFRRTAANAAECGGPISIQKMSTHENWLLINNIIHNIIIIL